MKILYRLSTLTAILVASSSIHAATKLAFVTSTTGTGDLSSWAEIQALPDPKPTGLDAGDTICQTRAEAANLPNPQTFVAWLSDSNDDAYCRALGLTGKSDNCNGQKPPSPADPGPWMRVDGEPFADKLFKALFGLRVFSPLNVDELGKIIPSTSEAYTGTGWYGGGSNSTCNEWTSSSNMSGGRVGLANRTSYHWVDGGDSDCDNANRLICLQAGIDGDPLPSKTEWGKRGAFVSRSSGKGNLSAWTFAGGASGVAAADNVCRKDAQNANFYQPNSYKAYISGVDDQGQPINAKDRFTYDGPWIRADGLRLANGITDLATGSLFRPLNVYRDGEMDGSGHTWTGTTATGVLDENHYCENWSVGINDNRLGGYGKTNTIDADWMGSTHVSSACGQAFYLYCLSDADVIFHNEFDGNRL